jgi:diguanylate cyclase (GGDEF)-like protein
MCAMGSERRRRPPAVPTAAVVVFPALFEWNRTTALVLASCATLLTVGLLIDALQPRLRPGRRRVPHDRRARDRVLAGRTPGDALALVGNALAATHDPRALLPVILEVVTDATGAVGGRVVDRGENVSWIGEDRHAAQPLELELARSGDRATRLVLYPPVGGFSPENRSLAAWLASQASIALENAWQHHAIQEQAATDDLTGLVNRRRFLEVLESEIVRAETLGTHLSLLLVDLDHFKLVNDRFGHQAGDQLLRKFAARTLVHLRDVDVAARLGGDEFALLLPETALDGAETVAERLRRSPQALPVAAKDVPIVTASVGVAQHAPGEVGDDLLRRADVALYEAKSEGRNRVVTASPPEVGSSSGDAPADAPSGTA